MSNKECKLHPEKMCARKKADKGDKAPTKANSQCDDCAPWQRYLLYAIPFLLYIPWAIKTMKCPPKCCPPASTCLPPPPPPMVCCPKTPPKPKCPKKQVKEEEPVCCAKKPKMRKKQCDE